MNAKCLLLYNFADYLKTISLVDRSIADGARRRVAAYRRGRAAPAVVRHGRDTSGRPLSCPPPPPDPSTGTTPASQRVESLNQLSAVKDYCENEVECRRAMLLLHFNESFHRAECGRKCDNCVHEKAAAMVDATLPLAALCQLLQQHHMRDRFTVKQVRARRR